MKSLEIKNKIKKLKATISELTDKINEQWQKELNNYKAKDSNGDYYYINGGWNSFKETNKDYQKREELERELKAITPPLTVKEKLKSEENYLKSNGLLKTAKQRNQWRLTKQGLINTEQLMSQK